MKNTRYLRKCTNCNQNFDDQEEGLLNSIDESQKKKNWGENKIDDFHWMHPEFLTEGELSTGIKKYIFSLIFKKKIP